jgi:protein-arginine kinase activator protein McsA
MKHNENGLIKIMQDRLDDCVVRENYEMAAKLRDLIEYETTDNEEYKHQYYLKLLKKYEKN